MPYSPEHLPPAERLEAQLNLRSQYEALRKALNESGVLQILPSQGELGIVGLDPQASDTAREYPMPSLESISAQIRERAAELETKINQDFTKLLLVPIASSLGRLKYAYAESLKNHHQNHKLFDSEGKLIDLDTETPVWAWDAYENADLEGKLVYYPKSFDQNSHGGMTKQNFLEANVKTPFPGWQVRLIEDLPNLPGQGQGKTVGGRKQVEANQTPREYLRQPQTQEEYEKEDGMTPEEWLSLAITHLKETNQVLDDYQGKGKLSYLTGAYFPASGRVPGAFWDRYYRGADLDRCNPVFRNGNSSARRSVGV